MGERAELVNLKSGRSQIRPWGAAMNELLKAAEAKIETVVGHYETSAPTVSEWADDVYRRMNSNADTVRLSELMLIENLLNPEPMHPNYAANRVYKLMQRLGMQTTGHAGF